jgi:hypothetical protein
VAFNLQYRWRQLMFEGRAAAVDDSVTSNKTVREMEVRSRELDRPYIGG